MHSSAGVNKANRPLVWTGWRHGFAQRVEHLPEGLACEAAEDDLAHGQRPGLLFQPNQPRRQLAVHDRQQLEPLCRCTLRTALPDERVQVNTAGQMDLGFVTPWRDGTTHLVTSPLELMQGLAALVWQPRLHLLG